MSRVLVLVLVNWAVNQFFYELLIGLKVNYIEHACIVARWSDGVSNARRNIDIFCCFPNVKLSYVEFLVIIIFASRIFLVVFVSSSHRY